MDFAEATRTRRTVGAYTDTKVDDALIREALTLSLWAPNHRLTYPVRYVDLGTTTRAGLAELAVELKSAKSSLSEMQRSAIRDGLTKPSHLILLARTAVRDAVVAHEDYATLACGVQIATTFLWENGVATKWSTAGWATHARTYEIAGLDPAHVTLEGCLIAGVAQRVPPAPPRPDLNRILSTTI